MLKKIGSTPGFPCTAEEDKDEGWQRDFYYFCLVNRKIMDKHILKKDLLEFF